MLQQAVDLPGMTVERDEVFLRGALQGFPAWQLVFVQGVPAGFRLRLFLPCRQGAKSQAGQAAERQQQPDRRVECIQPRRQRPGQAVQQQPASAGPMGGIDIVVAHAALRCTGRSPAL
ncbi:hypothetical protein D3C78_1322230 [compost metagenome]